MAKYKVTNLDAPIEADYWVDIPIRDPDTNKDMVDEEGRILVQRHVTRTVKQNEYQSIVNKIPTYDNLVTSYNTYVTENNRQVNLISEMATTATNNVTKLTETVNNHDSQIHALYTKINAIQGIDIDDFKLVTETNIKSIKKSYLPLAGGTLTGAVTINNNLTVTGTITSTFHGNLTGNVIGNVTGNITGSAKSATNDSVNRSIINTYALKNHYPDRISINWDTTIKNYVNLTVDQTTWGLITTANIAQQAVNYANTCNKANSATTAGSASTALSCTNANHAVKADTAIVADKANKASIADKATRDSSNNIIIDTYATKSSVASVNTTATNAAKKATDAYNAAISVKGIADNANNAVVVAQSTANNAYNTAVNAGKAAVTANTAATNANNNANNRVHLTSAQTITAQHNFSNGVKVSGYLITIG